MLVGRRQRHCEPAVPRGTAVVVASEAWDLSEIDPAKMSEVTVAVDNLLAAYRLTA